jgi:hypothetical protein
MKGWHLETANYRYAMYLIDRIYEAKDLLDLILHSLL